MNIKDKVGEQGIYKAGFTTLTRTDNETLLLSTRNTVVLEHIWNTCKSNSVFKVFEFLILLVQAFHTYVHVAVYLGIDIVHNNPRCTCGLRLPKFSMNRNEH